MPRLPQPSLTGRALRLLARREYSRAELERKLAAALSRAERSQAGCKVGEAGEGGESGASRAQIGQVLDELAARGLLDDDRAAEALVSGRAARFGERRLRQVLNEKGLDAALVDRTLAPLRATELERARVVWSRRFGRPPADAAERARQARFLAARGFDADTIRRVVSGAVDAD